MGISQVKQKNNNKKQQREDGRKDKTMDSRQQNIRRQSLWNFGTLYVYSYRKNFVKLLTDQKSWLISLLSMQSLTSEIFTDPILFSLPTWPFWLLKSLLSSFPILNSSTLILPTLWLWVLDCWSLNANWLTNVLDPCYPYFQSRTLKQVPAGTAFCRLWCEDYTKIFLSIWCCPRMMKIKILLILMATHQHTQRCTHIHPYIYIYTHEYILLCNSSGRTCKGPIYGSNRSVWKLLVLDRNTWNHLL